MWQAVQFVVVSLSAGFIIGNVINLLLAHHWAKQEEELEKKMDPDAREIIVLVSYLLKDSMEIVNDVSRQRILKELRTLDTPKHPTESKRRVFEILNTASVQIADALQKGWESMDDLIRDEVTKN